MAQKNAGFFLRVFDTLPDPLTVYDRHYRINLVNQALVNLYHLPAREVVGKHCYEVFHQRNSVCENCHVREVFFTGATQRREMTIDFPDGQTRQFLIHCYPVRDDKGRIIRAMEHGRDVTEPRSLEYQLRVSEARYQTLVDHAREGIFQVEDGLAHLTFANQCLGEMMGYALEEILGRSMFEFMDKDMVAVVKARLNRTRQADSDVYELKLKRRDGSDLLGLISAAPLMVNNTFLGSLGMITDITRPKQMEAELRLAKEFNATIINGITDHLTVIEARTYRIIQANNSFLARVGLEPGMVLGKPCFEILFGKNHPCHEDGTWCLLQETCRLKHGIIGEHGYTDGQGRERIFQVATYPLFNNHSEVDQVIRLETDVTERRKTGRALASRSRELQRREHHLETLMEISRQVSSMNSLGELINSIQDIIREIFPGSDSLFLILDAGREQLLRLKACAAGVAEPLGRFLPRLEATGAMGELSQYLRKVRDPDPVTTEERRKLPAFLTGLLDCYRSWFGLPIFARQECLGFFFLGSPTFQDYGREDLNLVQALFAQMAQYIRILLTQEVRINQPRQPKAEKTCYGGIVGHSKKMQEIFEIIDLVAKSDAAILITGENGTGKELVARTIHQQSHRHRAPFVVAKCCGYSPTLLESELFGYERGAFPGAIRQRKGRIERAQRGTLFLDELGDISLATQVQLLRFLQDHCFERVGGETPIAADVRVLAATNRDLQRLVATGQFRDDLYYRLNVISLHLPPLRERKEDIPLLAVHFLNKYNQKEVKQVVGLAPEAMEALMECEWPGNVRQLENAVSHALILAQGDMILWQHLPRFLRESVSASASTSLADNERHLILQVLQEVNWNKHDAARRLQVSRSTLYSKIRRYGLQKNLQGSVSIQS